MAGGASLRLQGDASTIRFGNNAMLHASCGTGSGASIAFMSPRQFSGLHPPKLASAHPSFTDGSDLSVRAYLRHVPLTCIDVSIDTPCLADNPDYPSLWHCTWVGARGSASSAPRRANSTAATLGEVTLGYRVFLDCPVITYDELARITGAPPDGKDQTVSLTINYLSPVGSSGTVPVPFAGVDGHDGITFTAPYTAPPPSAPPLAPPPPSAPAAPPSPPAVPTSCYDAHQLNPSAPDGPTQLISENGVLYKAYCDISGGGWTRVFSNAFTANHAGLDFKIDCPCASGAVLNNGNGAFTSQGWQLGVTNCHDSNGLSGTIGGSTVKYSWRMDFDIADWGPATAIRHKGTNHENRGYDHTSWPAGADRITSNPMAVNGEFASVYKDSNGQWQWLARYNVGSFDITVNERATAPYFSYLYSGGGPGNCDASNSDGFLIKDYEVWAMLQTPRPSVASSCKELYDLDPSAPDGFTQLATQGGDLYTAYCDISGGGWTRVFSNAFTANHAGLDFKIDCPCASGAVLNNGNGAFTSQGWQLGVTNCHDSNGLSGTIGGSTVKYSWRMDFDIADWGPATAIRHKGTNHENRGYDHTSWPAGADRITSNPMAVNGEFASVYKDSNGQWQWLARYNVGSFDITVNERATAPYFSYLYSGGGPGNCDASNSDGFLIKDYEVFVK